ncbi:delta-like protein 4 isoform X1 [Hypanus sabinus]|uniref:delta-like protein 4 isoform X1 n=2 Tax=Hypanus sabinus TaxID=79690 RepID=UPI0028C3BDA0|nr:delta-like protein 4 isoform X1 [Hypanus sabinus]
MAALRTVHAALFFSLLPQVSCRGTFELKIHQFVNGGGSLASGGRCVPDCRTFFRVCLKHFQVVVSPEPCTYGSVLSPLLGDSSSFRVAATQVPLRLNFTFKWPGTFSLIVEAWNSPSSQLSPNVTSPEMLISRFAIQRHQPVDTVWSRDVQRMGRTQLHYSYRVVCTHHYYGEGCSHYCRPRNDTFGHYTCGLEGQRICMAGWENEYCTQPICRSGCSTQRGYCNRPGECKCHYGWQGDSCTECMQHPGCLHGTCEQPFQCNCREGWGGLFCNQDLNYCTHNKPCLNNATCTNTGQGSFTCSCQPGFTGVHCQSPVPQCGSSPCRNGGTCTESEEAYHCSCLPGYDGQQCENRALTCADFPCFNGGSCYQTSQGVSYICSCRPGFSGTNCEQKVDRCSRSPCANGGQCLGLGLTRMCRCSPGFAGQSCEISVNDCARNPCLHGASCLDQVNGYHCLCTAGYTGQNCGRRLPSDCDSAPCQHGGTCHAGLSSRGPVCQCPYDFVGRWCEISVREPSPSQKHQQLPSPVHWQLVSLGCGLAAFVLLLLAVVLAVRHLRSSDGHQPQPRLANAMNNRTDPQRDNLIAASQLKLAGLEVNCGPEWGRSHCKLTNCAAELGRKGETSPELKGYRSEGSQLEESLPLTGPRSEKLSCRISTIACACDLKYQSMSRIGESRHNDITTEV